ncbi:MAG: hypothetical protein ABI479_08405 [Gallionella sp.]
MKHNMLFNNIIAGICMAALASTAQADEAALNLQLPSASGIYTKDSQFIGSRSYLLALNESDAAKDKVAMPVAVAAEFEPPLFTRSNAHKYLGIGTVLLVGLTALSAPDEDCENNCPAVSPPRQTSGTTHTSLARATAAMAAATVTTGLLYHWDDFHLEDGLSDPDNQHAMLGAAGALLMLYAVHKSATSAVPTSHAGIAELGGVAMAVAIKITW